MEHVPTQSSSIPLSSPPSSNEAEFYYSGLPAASLLVARTGIRWEAPTGPEAYRKIRELRPVGNHALVYVWEDKLAPKVIALLDSMKVEWTSVDILRIGYAKKDHFPLILWIGVMPSSMSGDDGLRLATECKVVLEGYNIMDVEVEIRESVVTRSAGPQLYIPADWIAEADPTVDIREPLTAALGIPICSQHTPWVMGTGGFFVADSRDPDRLLLVTARHVLFPDLKQNELFEYRNESQPLHNVMLLSDSEFKKYLESIAKGIEEQKFNARYAGDCLEKLAGNEDQGYRERREAHWQASLDKANKAIVFLKAFYEDVSTRWATPESRVVGHVIYSPPIAFGAGSEGHTEDWAVIEMKPSKINSTNFDGNAIDLGTRSLVDLTRKMRGGDFHNKDAFEYPLDRLLRLSGTIPDEEMLGQSDNPPLLVIKRGSGTGLTIGRANNLCSYTRNHHENNHTEVSKEWPILPFNSTEKFSAHGDSGSVIVDGHGRIGGLITGGAGAMNSSNVTITYATPINFLLRRMQANGLHGLDINPALAT